MKKPLAITLLLMAGAAIAETTDIQLLSTDDLDWTQTSEGVAFAALKGDRFAEPYQAMVRLPAGTVSPPHVKTANMYGVLLQGEMIHYAINEDPETVRKIGPGSFYAIAGGLAHTSACVSETPCLAYLYQDGAFDFNLISN
ncbi:protein of unknown function [Epibacterium ulvae]|uniref:ChrR-like cupin domain-containing protein n=1 Tax=Epibacterium ulvae TaxID=1156985 RepID=A0A1G5QGB0_9RHOB|nr:DUF4437 domain-containing protein [Epibacterium ulvae]SCZ60913.1 protein of unknown function [Epibacterium ulvae]